VDKAPNLEVPAKRFPFGAFTDNKRFIGNLSWQRKPAAGSRIVLRNGPIMEAKC